MVTCGYIRHPGPRPPASLKDVLQGDDEHHRDGTPGFRPRPLWKLFQRAQAPSAHGSFQGLSALLQYGVQACDRLAEAAAACNQVLTMRGASARCLPLLTRVPGLFAMSAAISLHLGRH